MVIDTIGIGEYGAGVEGKFAVDCVICNRPGSTFVGGLVAGGFVATVGAGADGTVVAAVTPVVDTGVVVVVGAVVVGAVVVVVDFRTVG